MFHRHLGETESQRCALEERTAEGSTPPRAVCICIRNHSLSLTVTSVEHKCNRSDGATVIDWVCTNLGVQRPFIWEEIACAAAEPLQLNYDWLGRKNVFIFAAMTYSRCRHGGWLSAETPRPSPSFSVDDLGASDGWLPLVILGISLASRAKYTSWLSLLAADTTQSSAERGHRAGRSGQRLWGRHYKMCVFYNVSAVHSINLATQLHYWSF